MLFRGAFPFSGRSLLFLRIQHPAAHVFLAPQGWIILDLVPLLDGHPPASERATGVVAAVSMGEQILRRLDRSAGFRHLLQPGPVPPGNLPGFLRMPGRKIGRLGWIVLDVLEPPGRLFPVLDQPPLFPAGCLYPAGVPEKRLIGIRRPLSEKQGQQVLSLAMPGT